MSTASQYDTRQSVIQQKPQYIEDIDQALLGKYFGEPLKEGDEYTDPQTGETRVLEAGDPIIGQLMGGTMDDPSIFNIPDYVQAGEQRLDAEGNVIEASRTPALLIFRIQWLQHLEQTKAVTISWGVTIHISWTKPTHLNTYQRQLLRWALAKQV
tara:strand:+ start:204 stop:668 length:465 start_codon:yes stop_codon:yes gene_type:complete